jgi:hypothetical protein
VQVAIQTGTILAALAVALRFPSASEKVFAVVGATAVCVVVYIVPVFIHIKVFLAQQRDQEDRVGAPPLLLWLCGAPSRQRLPASSLRLTFSLSGLLGRWHRLGHRHRHPPHHPARLLQVNIRLLGAQPDRDDKEHKPGRRAATDGGWRHLGRHACHAQLVVPCIVLMVGVSFSVSSLWVGLLHSLGEG